MKLITLLFCIISCITSATSQTWQSINSDDISPINVFTSSGDGGTIASKWFKINPYDNSIWMGWTDKIQVLRNDGSIELFDYTTHPILNQYGNMLEFEFTNTHAYVVDENFGLYRYDGINWSSVYITNGGTFISSDVDTVWMSKSNNSNFIQSYDGFSFPDVQTYKRVVSKNGKKWISGSSYDISVGSYNGGVLRLYSPDTSFLLSWSNHDFKYANNNDSLYVAGDLGFSIAYGNKFVDTITPGNSSNMPSGEVIEFEFDNQNNIWAVFGNSAFYANSIAYYDQITETWTQVYNSSNSPIDYTKRISIEVDTSGNLWVTDGQYLHILKINNPPAWLGTQELENDVTISIYPNPVQNELNIQNDGLEIEKVEIIDLNGKILISTYSSEKISTSKLNEGIYVVQIYSNSGRIYQKRFIKQ